MTDEPLLRKLQVKHGRSLRLVNAPDSYVERISPLPQGSQLLTEGFADVVQVFVRDKADVEQHAEMAISSGAILWMTYPKGGDKVDTDLEWEALARHGWRPVAQISIDEVWSAVRFRPSEDIQPRAR